MVPATVALITVGLLVIRDSQRFVAQEMTAAEVSDLIGLSRKPTLSQQFVDE